MGLEWSEGMPGRKHEVHTSKDVDFETIVQPVITEAMPEPKKQSENETVDTPPHTGPLLIYTAHIPRIDSTNPNDMYKHQIEQRRRANND